MKAIDQYGNLPDDEWEILPWIPDSRPPFKIWVKPEQIAPFFLNLSEETRKMFSVMGLGMQTEQSCCGAFTVAVGIIGLMTAKEGQTDVDNMEGCQMITELTEFVLGFYGTLHCVELQDLEIVGYENPCHAIVEALARKLEELLSRMGR